VYFTREISAASLVRAYQALSVSPASGDKVAVKISSGEPPHSNYLRPELIGDLVHLVKGDIVEDDTAYHGKRHNTADHYKVIREHGFDKIATCKILDESKTIDLPVAGGTYLKFDRVGAELKNYQFLVNLAHFKGHAMAGFGGVLKNASIGLASSEGKNHIHSAGQSFTHFGRDQDGFLCSMAEAAQAVHNSMGAGKVVYIDVMNRLSVDCDCDGNPAEPEMDDIGIAASMDPVALDKACIDLFYAAPRTATSSNAALCKRFESRNGYLTVVHAAKIGLGSLNYELVNI
jgi:uncharacterized Fe-S center protein